MGKIGILTFHDTTNFGSWLQTFGLYNAIQNAGYDCEVIDYKCKELVRREIPAKFSFTFNPKSIIKELFLISVVRKKYESLTALSKVCMRLSDPCNRETIKDITKNYDKIIIGSDIVWGLDITDGDMSYFLDFISERKKKIAFSSSIGNPWTEEQIALVKDYVRDFDAIAMREEDAACQVKSIVDIDVDTVCDPTMLVDVDVWNELAIKPKKKSRYCLVYFNTSTNSTIQYAKKWAEENNAKVKFINYGLPVKGVENVRPVSVGDFLGLIKYADFVCTASYHGLLFSLYFNKQMRYFNRAHKSRMFSLTRKLGISEFDGNARIHSVIDYSPVNKNIKKFREYSFNILRKMLAR